MLNFPLHRFFYIGILLLLQSPREGNAQNANFDDVKTLCVTEQVVLNNTSTQASSQLWDFCLGDFETAPAITTVQGPLVYSSGVKIVENEGTYYGFATAFDALVSGLYRFDFGTSLANEPTITFMTNIGLTGNPMGLDIVKEGALWIGIVGYGVNGGQFRRLVWSELSQLPAVQDLSNFGFGGRFWDLVIQKQGASYVVVTPYYNGNTLVRINFGSTLMSNPTISDVTESGALSNVVLPRGISLQRKSGNIYALINSQSSKNISLFSLGSDLFSDPNHIGTKSFGTFSNLSRLKAIQEGDQYYCFVSNTNNAVRLIDLKGLDDPTQYSEIPIPNSPISEGIDIYNENSTHYLIGTRLNVFRMIFDAACGTMPRSSGVENPEVSYNAPGTFEVSLKAFDGELNYSTITKNAQVINSLPPEGNLVLEQAFCVNSLMTFEFSTMSNVVGHNWDFGDGQSSTQISPIHQYGATGNYIVDLAVTDDNGCISAFTEDLDIIDQPIANFDLPNTGPAPICTNQEYLFANTSTFDLGSNPTWQWEVNGSPVSSDEDLNYTIPSAVMQDVKLIASIPGCETELMQTINTVEVGPSPDFIFNNDCEDTSILFTNTTSGATTGFSWDFGDGNSSLQSDPSNTFVDFGNYDVTLQATNAAGCINSVVKPIQIYSKPITDFSIDLPPFSCAGTSSQFNDLTPSPTDSNLSGWAWTFGDPQNGTSTVRHAQYVYQQAGMYDVELEVTTNFGCKESIQKQITIFQSPGVDFQFEAACVGEATQFTDLSESGVTSWQWNINGTASTLQNPTYTFPAPTVYNASLTVTGSNNCIATLIRPVNVPAPPVLDFLVENNCATQTTLFSDNSQYGSDQPSTHSWLFEAGTQALGSSAEYSFASVGTFPTQLTVTSQSGCEYTLTKNVQIVNPPVASFVATAMEGGPPLSVSLINQSLNSVSRQWTINGPENFSSTQVSPTFILNELGDYTVDLRAQNASGCSDVTSKIISVITPSLDIVLEELTLIQSGANEVSILVTLRNHSNFTTSNLAATVNAGGAALINELISATIPPGEAYTQALKTRIAGTKTTLEFVCVEIIAEGDVNPDNNKKCENLNSEIVTFNPYPNPSTSELNFDWIAATSGSAEVTIFNSNGQSVFQNSIPNFEVGLNSLSIQMPILNAGIYYIVFVSGNTRNSYPFMVQN